MRFLVLQIALLQSVALANDDAAAIVEGEFTDDAANSYSLRFEGTKATTETKGNGFNK